ncbi:uncharacterized protein METZ01_LOCUS482145, partial [marine metagenome]
TLRLVTACLPNKTSGISKPVKVKLSVRLGIVQKPKAISITSWQTLGRSWLDPN